MVVRLGLSTPASGSPLVPGSETLGIAGELPGTGSHVTYEAAQSSSEFPGESLMAVHTQISPAEAADRLVPSGGR